MMGYIIFPPYRDLQKSYFPNILLYMRICIPQYQGSHILPQYISGLLQSLFLSMMVLLLFISPQHGSFAHPHHSGIFFFATSALAPTIEGVPRAGFIQ